MPAKKTISGCLFCEGFFGSRLVFTGPQETQTETQERPMVTRSLFRSISFVGRLTVLTRSQSQCALEARAIQGGDGHQHGSGASGESSPHQRPGQGLAMFAGPKRSVCVFFRGIRSSRVRPFFYFEFCIRWIFPKFKATTTPRPPVGCLLLSFAV